MDLEDGVLMTGSRFGVSGLGWIVCTYIQHLHNDLNSILLWFNVKICH